LLNARFPNVEDTEIVVTLPATAVEIILTDDEEDEDEDEFSIDNDDIENHLDYGAGGDYR
jgi:hypothetical protein